MSNYFNNILTGLKSFAEGLHLTLQHFHQRKKLVATLQYPHEKWPIPERSIGFELEEYNVIRSRLEVDIEDCIGCLQCERACPVDCIKIETIKPPKGSDFDCGVTSNGTQMKMLVSRFSIDMTECMFCNLCTYPCPEDCIYMVGGPNSKKHEIEYEYAARERSPLIFEFAKATEEQIIAAGGQDYLDRKKGIVPEPKSVKTAVKKETPAKGVITAGGPDIKLLNDITDKMVRGTAKKAFMAAKRAKKDAGGYAEDITNALQDSGMLTDEVKSIIKKIAASGSDTSTATVSSGPDIKKLNDIQDKMVRGLAKKSFMAAKRAKKSGEETVSAILADLKEAGKLTGDLDTLVRTIIPEPVAKQTAGVMSAAPDIKKLNILEDKLVRGLAKKSFMAAKRAKKSADETVADILKSLKEADKLTPQVEKVIRSIAPVSTGIEKAAKPEFSLDIRKLNVIEDKLVRGLAKKAFMAAKREKCSGAETVDRIKSVLTENNKWTDDIESVINSLTED